MGIELSHDTPLINERVWAAANDDRLLTLIDVMTELQNDPNIQIDRKEATRVLDTTAEVYEQLSREYRLSDAEIAQAYNLAKEVVRHKRYFSDRQPEAQEEA